MGITIGSDNPVITSAVGGGGGAVPRTLAGLDDFSAPGLTEGDYGIYTAPAGGAPVLFRYKAAVTRDSGAGGSTVPAWLPPEVYDGNPTLRAYLVGNESVTGDTALNARGWSVVSRTNGTITSQTTRVRIATTGANGNARIETMTSGMETTTKVYARALTRLQVGNGTSTAAAFIALPAVNNGSTGINPVYLSQDASKGTFFWNSSTTPTTTGFDKSPQATVSGLSGSDDMVEVIVNTARGTRACELRRNGIVVSVTDQVSNTTLDRITYQAGSFNAAFTSLATGDLSQVQVFTW